MKSNGVFLGGMPSGDEDYNIEILVNYFASILNILLSLYYDTIGLI